MNKYFQYPVFILLLFFCVGNLLSQNNVGIGTLTPAYRLDIQSDPANSAAINLNSKVNYVGNLDIKAVEGMSVTNPGYGIGGKLTGGYKGLDALCQGGNYSGTAYGIYSNSTGSAGNRYGVYGTASGGTNNYGVIGSASGGTGYVGVYGDNPNTLGYAGYFNGRGRFVSDLFADRNLTIDDTAFCRNIYSQSSSINMKAINDLSFTIDRTNNPAFITFFEVFNGAGNFLFWINEGGTTRTYGSQFVDGNVGIGTTAPTTKLNILGGADAGLATNGYAQFGASNTWNLVLDDNEILARNNGVGNDLLMQQDDGNILMCGLEQGQVGIGVQLATNLPTGYMLAVDGKIIGEEMRIQNSNNWPDYVFADHYELMPLDELKQTIEEQNHLPNIPSAETVAQEGILVGDMQKRMMEKIEELTLYILDLHEINKQQQAEIDQMKSLIAGIKER